MTGNYGLVETLDDLERLCTRLIDAGQSIGFDIETGYRGEDKAGWALHPETAMVVGISLTNDPSWARYTPLDHDCGDNVPARQAARLLWSVLATGLGVAHNACFELRHLSRFFMAHLADDPEVGEAVRASNGYFPVRSDTQVEAYLSAEHRQFGLKYLADAMFGHKMTELHELFGDGLTAKARKMLRFNPLDFRDPRVRDYACEDAAWCLAVHQRYYETIRQRHGQLFEVELEIATKVLPEMEDFGVPYDWDMMRRTLDELTTFQDRFNAEIMADLSELAGRPVAISLASPAKLGQLLFDELGMKTTVYTAKTRNLPKDQRRMSTGKIALERLSKQFPVVRKIVQWKEMARLAGTYLTKYEQTYRYASDGRTHPNHMSAVVVTGRFAVADPPYQQCVPGEYEVLTPQGWVRLDALAEGVPVVAYVDDGPKAPGHTEFVVPEIVKTSTAAGLLEFRMPTHGVWRYTHNHRLPVWRANTKGDVVEYTMSMSSAGEWYSRWSKNAFMEENARLSNHWLRKGAPLRGQGRLSDAERDELWLTAIALCGRHVADEAMWEVEYVHGGRPLDVARAVGLGARLRVVGDGRETCEVIEIDDALLSRWWSVEEECRLPLLLALDGEDLRVLVDTLLERCGVGFYAGETFRVDRWTLTGHLIVELAPLVGYAVTRLRTGREPERWRQVQQMAMVGSGLHRIERIDFWGHVYCLTVPSGMFLLRNEHGDVTITGNSPKKYHFDLVEAKQAHERHAEDHGPKCTCADPQYAPPAGACFTFNFRDVIVAPPDHYLLGFDLSQAELRAIAGEAKEAALLEAFANGQDVHSLTAALMLNIPYEEVGPDQRSVGKAQPLDARVLTPSGYRYMGDLRVGDLVIGAAGTPVKVTGIFPQGKQKVYRVDINEGGSTECTADHLWTVHNIGTKTDAWRTRTLGELIESGIHRRTWQREGVVTRQPKFELPRRPVVRFTSTQTLPVDPYTLGCVIGDIGTAARRTPKLIEVVEREILDELGLWRVRVDDVAIPQPYLLATPSQRLALLRGLLDTRGVPNISSARFSAISTELLEGIQFLVRSLGGWASVQAVPSKDGRRERWQMTLRLRDNTCPFTLPDKVRHWHSPKYTPTPAISRVTEVGEKLVQCISVDAPDGLYITDSFMVTHNTMNFALVYGMGAKSLADRLAIGVEEAKSLYASYFAAYPGIKAWSDKQVKDGKTYGYVVSHFGRILPIWEFQSEDKWIYAKGERACVNYPIQGAATGDYMKYVMTFVYHRLREHGLHDRIHLMMNVHDALEFAVHRSVGLYEALRVLAPAVTPAVKGWPAMRADWHIARRWGSPRSIQVGEGGQLFAEGSMVRDGDPEVDVDDDSGEDVVTFAAEDVAAVQQVVKTLGSGDPQPVDTSVQIGEPAGSRRLIAEVLSMPDESSFRAFMDLLRQRPGDNRVTVRTPEGDLDIATGTDLDVSDLAEVTVRLGPCRLLYAQDSVDFDELARRVRSAG